MSRFRRLAHAVWYCQYHVVWVPKYRYRVLTGSVGEEVGRCVRVFTEQQACEVVELNVQADHLRLIAMIAPKVSVSECVGTVKGRTAIRVFRKFPDLRDKPCRGNHFWAPGYCIDTVGLNAEMVRRHVKWQENRERREEQDRPFR